VKSCRARSRSVYREGRSVRGRCRRVTVKYVRSLPAAGRSVPSRGRARLPARRDAVRIARPPAPCDDRSHLHRQAIPHESCRGSPLRPGRAPRAMFHKSRHTPCPQPPGRAARISCYRWLPVPPPIPCRGQAYRGHAPPHRMQEASQPFERPRSNRTATPTPKARPRATSTARSPAKRLAPHLPRLRPIETGPHVPCRCPCPLIRHDVFMPSLRPYSPFVRSHSPPFRTQTSPSVQTAEIKRMEDTPLWTWFVPVVNG